MIKFPQRFKAPSVFEAKTLLMNFNIEHFYTLKIEFFGGMHLVEQIVYRTHYM